MEKTTYTVALEKATENVKVDVAKLELPMGDLLTETGRVKNPVRDKYSKVIRQKVMGLDNNAIVANDNSILLPLARAMNGEVVYARIQVAITEKDTFATKGGKKADTGTKLEIPEI